MPRCKNCGNSKLFASSKVPPAAPSANGPVSGMMCSFTLDNDIESITSMGADKTMTRAAVIHPQLYFDLCIKCGSQDIEWE